MYLIEGEQQVNTLIEIRMFRLFVVNEDAEVKYLVLAKSVFAIRAFRAQLGAPRCDHENHSPLSPFSHPDFCNVSINVFLESLHCADPRCLRKEFLADIRR